MDTHIKKTTEEDNILVILMITILPSLIHFHILQSQILPRRNQA
jgi:hypothetical protein